MRWDPSGTGLRRWAEPCQSQESLVRGSWASCSTTGGHGRTARAGHTRETPSASASGAQEHLIMKQAEDPKETSVCSGERRVHLSIVTK